MAGKVIGGRGGIQKLMSPILTIKSISRFNIMEYSLFFYNLDHQPAFK